MIIIAALIFMIMVFMLGIIKYKQIKFLYDRTSAINETIMRISEEINSFHDIDELYKQILKDTVNLVECAEAGSILVYNKDKDYMEYKASVYYDLIALKNIFFKKEELFLYKTKALKEADIIANPHKFDKENVRKNNLQKLEASNSLVCKSCISAPLYINGGFYGIINIDCLHSENTFTKRDVRIIQYICRQLEMTIKNVLLVNQLTESLRIDKLTGIYNRRYFEEIVESRLSEAESLGEKFSLVMIDMDNFKSINDNLGHKAGDEALKVFANKILDCLGHKDIAARFAGDEFVIGFYDIDEFEIKRRIEYIRNYFQSDWDKSIKLQFSAGVCTYEKGMDYDKLLVYADKNMYQDKRERKSSG